ncbi:MAG: type II CRISPR RNA-guided endonuclease Cas9, partial [Acutalibacteraceae bacterium]|nr:type II CRISPR RNA-guided endonuclease Cas9 [Acutalibacteraceae bacterium]
FRDELEIRTMNDPQLYLDKHPLANYGPDEKISPIFVSRMAKRKNTGPAHMETVKSGKYVSEGILLKKVELTKLKLDKDGEIDGYFNPESDLLLYNALKARLAAFDGDGAKAFAEPFYKPKHDGTKGPVVKKVKVYEKTSLNVSVQDHKGVADNGSMIRVDVFVRDGKYYLVPIYVSDTVKDKLPNKAIVAHKPYDEWVEMNDDEFVFSLYPRDLIKVTSNKDMSFSLVNKDSTLPEKMTCRECFVYYVGTDIATASISVINHDNTYKIRGLGVKTLPLIEKYQVDVLGNITKVQKEKRQGFTK